MTSSPRVTLFATLGTVAALSAAAALALAAPLAASAHVTVTPDSAAASAYSVLTFSVGHGCDGSPTTAITFTVPDSIASVTPTVNPGWTIASEGSTISYTADTPLPDHQRTTFELSVKLPDTAGDTLAFPVLQQCEVGSIDWSQLSAEGEAEPEYPAPMVVLTESNGDAGGHGDGHDHAGDAADDDAAEHGPTSAPAAADTEDVLARVLGVGGLVVGAVGIVLAVTARRGAASNDSK